MSSNNSRTLDYYYYVVSAGALGSPLPSNSSISANTHVILNTTSSSISFPIVSRAVSSSTALGILGPKDVGKWLRLSHDTDTIYNLEDTTPADVIIAGIQAGEGRILFTTSSGAINIPTGYASSTRTLNSVFALLSLGSGNWDLMGDLGSDII